MGHAHVKPLTPELATIPKASLWRKLPVLSVLLGAACIGITFAVAGGGTQFWYSLLTGYMFWLAIGLGGFFFTLIHHCTRAGWSTVVRRMAENYMMTLPLLGVLGVVIAFGGMHDLFHWSHVEDPHVSGDLMLQAKAAYLNEGFFQIRSIIYLVLWTVVPGLFYRWSIKQDATGDEKYTHRMRWLAPVGLIVFAVTTTLAAIDFVMSLDPHWYSTIFGVYYFGGVVMVTMAVLSLTAIALQKSGILADHINDEHYHDLGKLAFGFVVFWSYIAFSQFMLIWYANIAEETLWYAHRIEGGWEWVTLVLALLHFVVPFFFLMSRHIKRRQTTLIAGCVLLLVAHFVDMFWLIQPTMSQHAPGGDGHTHFAIHIADLLALIGVGGLVMAVFTWRLGAASVAPLKDPRLDESLHFENMNL